MKEYIVTNSGRQFFLERPTLKSINIKDIAHALSLLCRFNGHTKQFYSIAQHSVIVASLVAPKYALFGLLHDASEAYIGDVTSPLKRLLHSAYNPIERRIMDVVARKFGFVMDEAAAAAVKVADMTVFAMEARDLMPRNKLYDFTYPPEPYKIQPWSSSLSEVGFMKAFLELTNASESIKKIPLRISLRGWLGFTSSNTC